ncbi:MAG: type II secretion system protein [Candidatus Jorgensenbacteria bacterium]|nr:type II secretion system protein [Candidatus Jorgensenbacteria bacterium]
MEKGFTLVETIVVIGIMMLLSGLFVGYNRTADEQVALFKDQALLVGAINRAKALAQQKLSVDANNKALNACAFGVRINSERDFFIFADKKSSANLPCINDNGQPASNYQYDLSEELESFSLDKRLSFTSGIGQDIIFVPPDLRLEGSSLPFIITIQNADNSRIAKVTITQGGQINTE